MKKIIPFLMALLLLAGCGAQSEESTVTVKANGV